MREIFPPTIALLVQVALLAQAPQPRPRAEKPLDVYFLDTEGGQATLFVSPYGDPRPSGAPGTSTLAARSNPDVAGALARGAAQSVDGGLSDLVDGLAPARREPQ